MKLKDEEEECDSTNQTSTLQEYSSGRILLVVAAKSRTGEAKFLFLRPLLFLLLVFIDSRGCDK